MAQKCVIGLLRLLTPPHVDNEEAADYLRTRIGQTDEAIEWAAVRPDGLTNEEDVSRHFSPMGPEKAALFGIKRFE